MRNRKHNKAMKKTVILAILALFALQGTLQAQYSQYYYHRTGDTIEHDSPTYFHSWWKWIEYYYSKRPLLLWEYRGNCDTNIVQLPQYYTPDTLKIIGIAGMRFHTASEFNPAHYDTTDIAHLYVVSDEPHTVLARVERSRWWDDVHRRIHIVTTGADGRRGGFHWRPEDWLADCCLDNHTMDDYFGVYEYYFDSAVYVIDTFYVGTSWSHFHYTVEELLLNPDYVDCDSLSCWPDEYNYLYNRFVYPYWTKGTRLQMDLVWPIIEIDTTVPPDFVCLPLEDLHVTALDTFAATVAWSDVSSQTTEVQVRYGPTATPNANWRTLTVAGGSRSATLGLPREEFADYAVMVRPLCDSLKTSAAWSDTVFFSLPRDTVGILSPHAAGFTLQPNPAMGSVSVTLAEGVALPAEVEVVDMAGRTVLARRATSPTLTLPLDGLPAGTYLVRAAGHTRRLVKN